MMNMLKDKQEAIRLLTTVKEDSDSPVILGAAGEIIRFTRRNASTNNNYVLAKATIPPGAGPLPHVHHLTNEWFFAPKDGLYLYMGSGNYRDVTLIPGKNAPRDHAHVVELRGGDLLYGPRGMIHGFVNNTDSDLEFYVLWTSADPYMKNEIFEFFSATSETLSSIDTTRKPKLVNVIKFFSESTKFGINLSSGFWDFFETAQFDTSAGMDGPYSDLVQLLKAGEMTGPSTARPECVGTLHTAERPG